MTTVRQVASRHHELVKSLRRLATDPGAARHLGQAWIEGEHLCTAFLAHGRRPRLSVIAESAWDDPAQAALARAAPEVVRMPDALLLACSALESAPSLGFLVAIGEQPAPQPGRRTVVLDRLQDPGNAGSLLRTAAALGFGQVMALKGTVSLWSPKVLRAGMGAHFGLNLAEGASWEAVRALGVPVVGTQLHDAAWLHECALPDPLAWVFGQEGQGLAADVAQACDLRVRIAQPGGEDSLNVAAAAAICLYESTRAARAGGGQ